MGQHCPHLPARPYWPRGEEQVYLPSAVIAVDVNVPDAKHRYNHLIRGSSDRASSTRGRRLSAASAMRRRSTRGSSISSLSSPSSPRSTVTPPPSRSSASSPGGSGASTTADGLALHSPIDLRHQWNPMLGDSNLLDDVPELAHSGSTSRSSSTYSHSSSPSLESQMLSMLMQNEFYDPSLDPSGLPPLTPSPFSLDGCSPSTLLPESLDPWSSGQFPYLDFSPTGPHGSIPFDAQLTPSLSTPAMSTSGSSVSSTPQLSDPHYASMHSSRFMPTTSEPQIAQYSGMSDMSMQYMHSMDPNDPHLGMQYMLCDGRGDYFHNPTNMMGRPMAASA